MFETFTDEDRIKIKYLRNQFDIPIMDIAIAYDENQKDIDKTKEYLREHIKEYNIV